MTVTAHRCISTDSLARDSIRGTCTSDRLAAVRAKKLDSCIRSGTEDRVSQFSFIETLIHQRKACYQGYVA